VSEKVTLFGEVVAVDGKDLQVRLDTDELAILQSALDKLPEAGYRGQFTLEGRSPDGQTIVSAVQQRDDAEDATAFDLEFDRLHSALSGRRAGRRAQAPAAIPSRSLQEEDIRNWIERVGTALGQLRKHRSKRLSEQVNDES
jgi:hypothetical protein